MTIGEKIVSLRKLKGLSQIEFAELIGVSRQSVSKWESGESLPDTDKVIAISSLFEVSTDWLLKEEEDTDSIITESYNNTEDPEEHTENESSENWEDDSNLKNKKKKSGIVAGIIAASIAICIAIAAVLPKNFERIKSTVSDIFLKDKSYPYVLVHGLGGWGNGSGMNNIAKYWGADTGDLAEYLNNMGYEVYTPSVGPLSSTWDRCCELYAILSGTTVDYGEAHSKEHNHKRFGRTYTQAMIPEWDTAKTKINLVGHSFGGETVRMFASLLEYGDENETNATGKDTSPLFEGGKGNLIHSVTTLCSPHNGSSLTCVLDSFGNVGGIDNTTEMLASMCFVTAEATSKASGTYDFMLDQFGIGQIKGNYTDITNSINAFVNSGNDHAGYELTPDGAKWLNSQIKMVDSAYYFSYSYSTTQKSSLLYTQVPTKDTLAILYPFALAMGSYNGKTEGGIAIDSTWLDNDGLVSVISAKAPFDEPQANLTEDIKQIKKGVWNVAETKKGHHGTVIGLDADTAETHSFYENLFSMIDNLR